MRVTGVCKRQETKVRKRLRVWSSSANYAPWQLAALIALAPDERLTCKREAARLITYSSVSQSAAEFVASVTLPSEEGGGEEKT